jgi:hypothetical protein
MSSACDLIMPIEVLVSTIVPKDCFVGRVRGPCDVTNDDEPNHHLLFLVTARSYQIYGTATVESLRTQSTLLPLPLRNA